MKSDCDKEILPPGDEDALETRRLPVPGFNEERRGEPVYELAVVDVTADMALVIRIISIYHILSIQMFSYVVSSCRFCKILLI